MHAIVRKALMCLSVVLGILSFGTSSYAGTITFNEVPSNTIITNTYPGVTFSAVSCGNPATCAPYATFNFLDQGVGGVATNTVGPAINAAWFDSSVGSVQATFDTPQSAVSINANLIVFEGLGDSARPFMDVYDSNDVLLAHVVYSLAIPNVGAGVYDTLSFAPGTNVISKLLFVAPYEPDNHGPTGMFDILTFSSNPTVVPLPGAFPLFAGGLGLMGWMARRRRAQAAHA